MLSFERSCWKEGYQWVAGVDEAGRGPLAGPVVAACVILPRRLGTKLNGLTDSKQLSEARREEFYEKLQTVAVAIGVGAASPTEIDAHNILGATFLAMKRAIAQVVQAEAVLVDGNRRIPDLPMFQQTIVKGDALSLSIAAASVVAKVTRDRLLVELDREFPHYGFARHKGYPTKAHYEALAQHGATPHHRMTFIRPEQLTLPL